jgi:hypothetical protein
MYGQKWVKIAVDKTAWSGLSGQDCQDKTARTGQAEMNRQNKTA